MKTASVITGKEPSEACNETQAEEKRMDYESTDDKKVAGSAGKEPLEKPVFTTECSAPQALLKPCSENDETIPKVDKESHIVVKVEHDCENAVLGVEITSKLPAHADPSCSLKDVYKGGHGFIDDNEVAIEGSKFSHGCDGILGPETSPKSKKHICRAEPILDSIAGRQRGRRPGRSNENEKPPSSDRTLKVEQTQVNASDARPFDSILAPETSLKSKRKRQAVEPIPDSIAGRLRERRARNN